MRNIPSRQAWRPRAAPVRALAAAAALCLAPPAARAQTEYRNTDAGRPLRIEDALPEERYEFDFQLAPVRVEQFAGTARRWRLEPQLSYGILPRTSVEARVPLVYREPGASPRGGVSGIGLGVQHALLLESPGVPAIGLSAETLLPVGSARAGSTASYTGRLLVTRSFTPGRLHLNALYGTYATMAPAVATTPGGGTPIPDFPCAVAPPDEWPRVAARCGSSAVIAAAAAGTRSLTGHHWLAGVGGDHAFALSSAIVGCDAFAERFTGLGRATDWTAECGGRRQLTPRTVADLGVGRHFAGANPSWIATAGVSVSFAAAFLMPPFEGRGQ